MNLIDNKYYLDKDDNIVEKGLKHSFVRQDNTVRAVYNDILQGATYSILLDKIQSDAYGVGYKYSYKQATRIITKARKLIKEDFQEQMGTMREDMYSRLLDTYTESREMGDRNSALRALDQLAKLTGLYEAKLKVDADVNQNVTIDFGFKNDEEE